MPEVGRVSAVAAVTVNAVLKAPVVVSAPAVVSAPPRVILALFATPVPPLADGRMPLTPVVKGRPVAFVSVALVGVPNTGVTNAGLVVPVIAPVPFNAEPRAVAILSPKPETPVDMGKPVALVKTAAEGVPKAGVTRAGDVARTTAPEPVTVFPCAVTVPEVGKVKLVAALTVNVVANAPDVVKAPPSVILAVFATPVPPLADGKTPVTPVVSGSPVALVNTPLAGVPSAGVTKTGLVVRAIAPEPLTASPNAVRTPVPVVVPAKAPALLN